MKYCVVKEGKKGRVEDRGELSIMIAVTVVKREEICYAVIGVLQPSIYSASMFEHHHGILFIEYTYIFNGEN